MVRLTFLIGYYLTLTSITFLVGPRAWSQEVAPAPAPGASADAYVKFGVESGRKGDLASAIQAFSQAIKIDPKWAPAYGNRGYAYSLENKLDEAIADYDKAIQIEPKYQDAYYNRGTAKAQKAQFDAAIDDFNQAISLNPKYATAYYNRGHAKYFKGDLDGALADLNQAITLDPNSPSSSVSYFIRGLVRHAQTDREGAVSDFQRSADSGFPYGAFWFWIVKMENAERGLARTNLEDYVAKPELFKPDAWSTQIANFLLEKLPQDQLLTKAQADSAPKDRLCEVWFYAGMVKYFAGDTTGALSCFQQSTATGASTSEEYIEAQRQTAKLQQP